MTKYLDRQTVNTYLNLGRTIEVFLGRICENKQIIRYLSFEKLSNGKIEVTLLEHYDEGNIDLLDIYSFTYVDPDMDFKTFLFDNIDNAIDFISDEFSLNEIKFINAGMIQDEYAELLKFEGRN
jgi:hypothetical protein